MNWYITFSGAAYHSWTQRIVEDAPKYGADRVLVYDDAWLREHKPWFMEAHRDLFEKKCCKAGHNRGFGWYIWKPTICRWTLDKMAPGDICIYSDGDTFPIADLSPLYKECDKVGLMCFSAVGWTQRPWNKRDCQILMEMDEDYYRDKPAACARFLVFKKGAQIPFSPTVFYPEGGVLTPEHFFDEWYRYLSDIRINTFDPSTIKGEYSDLTEPRTDQSVEGNVVHRHGLKLYREACGFGDTLNPDGIPWPQDRELYGQLFEQRGDHSFDPNGKRDGSVFRNVWD